MKSKPLEHRGIVVTRPRELARRLASLVESAGGRALLFPAVEIEDLPAPPRVALDGVDVAIFISPTAVEKALKSIGPLPARVRVAAVGAGTRRELERHGVANVLAPATGADSEALLALPELRSVAGSRIAILRGEGGRSLLGDTLAQRGARVEYVECYRRVRPRADAAPLIDAWKRGSVDAVTVSSGEGLANLFGMLDPALLRSVPLFVPHPRVAEEARAHGAGEIVLAGPGDDEMLARLVAYFEDR